VIIAMKKQQKTKPIIVKEFNQGLEIEKYLDEGRILGKIYLMMQSNPKVIESALESTIEPMRNERNVILLDTKLYEISRGANFLGALEIELLTVDFRTFINIAMKHGPVRVDLIEPDEIFLSIDNIQNIVADVSEMHKTLMAHVASALKDNEKVISPWDIISEKTEPENDSGKISCVMFIELQHEKKEILEKIVENKISQIKSDKNINLINISDYGIEKSSEIVGYEDEEDEQEPEKEDIDSEQENDFYSGVLEIKFTAVGFRKLLNTVLKYQASGIEILGSDEINLSKKQANLLLGDVIKTSQMLSEQLQILLSDPGRKARYDAALREGKKGCATCVK